MPKSLGWTPSPGFESKTSKWCVSFSDAYYFIYIPKKRNKDNTKIISISYVEQGEGMAKQIIINYWLTWTSELIAENQPFLKANFVKRIGYQILTKQTNTMPLNN